MPRKIKELEAELKHNGFTCTPGKGSHRKWRKGAAYVLISGKSGDDAKPYQEKQVEEALSKTNSK